MVSTEVGKAELEPEAATDAVWLSRIEGLHSQSTLPGFWDVLEDNCNSWAIEISNGDFWKHVKNTLVGWKNEYHEKSRSGLLSSYDLSDFDGWLPDFKAKPIASIKDKLIRECRKNVDFLAQAIRGSGPPIPNLVDLIRTRITCNFIDGVEFLASKIHDLALRSGLSSVRDRRGRIEGYFAQHILISQNIKYKFMGEYNSSTISCEIQIATNMGTRMWIESHGLYEKIRGGKSLPEDWQWNPNDPRFLSNQLGHLIHLVDGLLVKLRDSINIKRSTNEW